MVLKYEQILCKILSSRILRLLGPTSKMSGTTGKFKWAVQLICPNSNHDPIKLPHREIVYIGRTPETRIVDPRCSRKQVQLTADLMVGSVQVVQIGGNSSSLDGIEMIKDRVYTMKPDSTLCVLTGLYPKNLNMKSLKTKEKDGEKRKLTSSTSHKDDKKMTSPTSSNKTSIDNTASGQKRKHSSSSHDNAASGQKKRQTSSTSPAGSTNKISSELGKSAKNNIEVSPMKSHMPGAKRSSSNSNDISPPAKKQRLSSNGKPIKTVGDDEDHMTSVASRLEMLKANAKKIKVPASPKDVVKNGEASGSVMQKSGWSQYDSLYVYNSEGVKNCSKIAAFDIDGTIITTQSGKTFPTHPGDYRLLFQPEISKKLKKLSAEGYKIVFITNQMGVSRGKTNIADLKTKFVDVIDEIEVPVQVLVSTKGGMYRKPCTGMWDFLCEKGNGGVQIDVSKSFYVGDAAGRPKNWAPKKKKDFSSSDRLFALNVGLKFLTPEEYFKGYPTAKFEMPEFDPRKLSSKIPLLDPESAKLTLDKKEAIVMVGSPASGKTQFVKMYLEPAGYVHINRDTLGSWQKCVTACKDNLKKGKSVVIDNTNPDPESRGRYVSAAYTLGVKCRCFVMTTSHMHARHNERFREMTDKSHQAINDMVMNSYKKKYRAPALDERFSEIVKVNFVPKFKNSKEEKLYKMFLLEK